MWSMLGNTDRVPATAGGAENEARHRASATTRGQARGGSRAIAPGYARARSTGDGRRQGCACTTYHRDVIRTRGHSSSPLRVGVGEPNAVSPAGASTAVCGDRFDGQAPAAAMLVPWSTLRDMRRRARFADVFGRGVWGEEVESPEAKTLDAETAHASGAERSAIARACSRARQAVRRTK